MRPPKVAPANSLALGGSRILEYPRILEAPTGEVLDRYREHQTGVMTWFLVFVVVALSWTMLPRWLAVGGYLAAGLIGTGVIVPVVEAASLTNFAGYVVWCAWLLAVVIVLWRTSADVGVRERHRARPARRLKPGWVLAHRRVVR